MIIGGLYVGSPEEGELLLRPVREFDEPLLDLSATLPYVALQQVFDPFFPPRSLRYYWKSLYLDGLDKEVVDEISSRVDGRPSPMSMAGLWALGGALGRVGPDETATGDRDAPFVLEILANWSGSEETARNVTWARDFCDAVQHFGTGKTNLNFPGLGEDPQFVRSAFGRQYDRLVGLKRKYDPANLFRLNQNIDPRDSTEPGAASRVIDKRGSPKAAWPRGTGHGYETQR